MEKEQLKQVANDIENLGASLSGLTSTLNIAAELYLNSNENKIGSALFSLLADSCKRLEDESYRIWEILRKEV